MNTPTRQPTTLRDILLPHFGAGALADAESRVYDHKLPIKAQVYACAEGRCALGVIIRWRNKRARKFPHAAKIFNVDRQPAEIHAANRIVRANDGGRLATPGALTELLDSPLPEWVQR